MAYNKLEEFRDKDDYSIETFRYCIDKEIDFIPDGKDRWRIDIPFFFDDGDSFVLVYKKEKHTPKPNTVEEYAIELTKNESIQKVCPELVEHLREEFKPPKEVERWVLSDEAHTLFHMSIFDIDHTAKEISQNPDIQEIIERHGLEIRDTELIHDLTDCSRLGFVFFDMITAIMKISELYSDDYINYIKQF